MTEDIAAEEHFRWMGEALREAQAAFERGDRPIGAVIVHGGKVVGRGSNTAFSGRSRIGHAEVNALLSCAQYLNEHGTECTIYTTCEPCVMCLGAIVMANLRRVVFGIFDNYICARTIIEDLEYVRRRVHLYVGGVREEECAALYRRFSEAEYLLMANQAVADAEPESGVRL